MKPGTDPLKRFRQAQADVYPAALRELRAGRKRTHWIWFVFPQLRGLGRSATSEAYGIADLAEARAYMADPVLGPRLREAAQAMLSHRTLAASDVLGELDALKFRSCLTLFALADPDEPVFAAALERFFAGERDPRTLELLRVHGDA
ncbi:DUF1810 domain-containing protein [Luteimonas kalidii]|uniref:DUF1810 domain-containing protein n=1 Tax=Luteimonas kalidii TaxID=3042025 RepID=A0ABT6JQL8_9GAMM|nr:DUF1810 domain-containing protein [Luteimonas kalidii]MDH5832907.1 DUF1810 domain-containing protein [Luteimonas kalidii]